MPHLTPQPADTLGLEPEHVGSASMVLKQLADKLQRQNADKILDLGPVCQENINFFAGRTKQLYVYDLFAQLNKIQQEKEPSGATIWEEIDFPPESFDCINLWDLLDHLNDTEALEIIRRCHEMVKPYGLVLVTAMEKALHPHNSSLFACGPDFHLTLRALPHIHLPWYYRHNRALMSLLNPFQSVKIFRYHNGIREMLFQRTKQAH